MVAPTSIVPVAGLTSTVATGTAFTVTAELPLFPSLVAVMVTGPPAALPVTRPFASTVARVALLVPHVTVRPVSALPAASFGVAVSCSVVPTITLAGDGVTSTDATGAGVTVRLDVPLLPSLVAVMTTGPPTLLPVTRPFASTVARVASLVPHVTVRPVSVLPFASFSVAVSCSVMPTATLAGAGVTATESTGAGVTVTADVPLLPSLVAVMVTGPPAALAVTTPFTSTVAMVASLVVHVTVRPVSGLPAASFGVAVSWRVVPVKILAVVGLTSTEATAILVWQAVDPVSVNVAPATGTN